MDIDTDSKVGDIGMVAGVLTSLGLTGVPITVVISLLVLNSWFICYFISLFTPELFEFLQIIQLLLSIAILVISFMLSIPTTAFMIKPLKGVFKKIHQQPISRSLIGATCRIRSSRADSGFGEAECIHEGASYIVKVRSHGEQIFKTNDLVVLIEHKKEDSTFNIIGEKEFKLQINS